MSADSGAFEELLAGLTPEQRSDLVHHMVRPVVGSDDAVSVPLQVNLSIVVRESGDVSPAALHEALAQESLGSPPLSVEDLETLQRIQPELIAWIRASNENAALFAVASVRAVQTAGIKLSAELMAKLGLIAKSPLPFGLVGEAVELNRLALRAESASGAKPGLAPIPFS